MKKLGYGVLVFLVTFISLGINGQAYALPSTDAIGVNYTDYPNVQGDLKALKTITSNNRYNGNGQEHDNTNGTQSQLTTDLILEGTGYDQYVPRTNGPHGKFTDNTEACARCHALHTAKSARLIRFDTMPSGSTAKNSIYGTCTYCHNFNGQSTYDVKDGMIWDTSDGKRYATSGGGFERMLVVEGEPEVATVVKASSSHMVNGPNNTRYKAPGGYQGATTSSHILLTCASCHNPHGSSNYRILRETIPVGKTNGVIENRATSTDVIYLKVNNPFNDEKVEYTPEITNFCYTCHTDYKSSTAGSPSGTYIMNKYRHKIGMSAAEGINDGNKPGLGFNQSKMLLPTANFPVGNLPGTVECITCHYAHGTFVRVKNISTYDNIYVSSSDNSINLQNLPGYPNQEPPKNLRMDNRGVCQNCHNWSSKSADPPVLTDVLDPDQQGTALYGDAGTILTNTKVISNNTGTIVIRFNQYMLKTGANGAETIGNYQLTNLTDGSAIVPLSSARVQPDGRTVVIRPTGALLTGKNYSLRVQNIQDSNFIPMNTTTENFSK